MHMIRSTVDGMQMPATMPAGFRDLFFDGLALFDAQPTCILRHFPGRFEFSNGVWKLQTAPVLHPAATIARQPRAIRGPRQEIGDGVVY